MDNTPEASSPRITHKAKSSTSLARIVNLAFALILILAHVRLQVQPARRALDPQSHSLIGRLWLMCLKGTPTTKCTLQNLSLTA